MKHVICALGLIATLGCSGGHKSDGTAASNALPNGASESSSVQHHALYFANEASLPACNGDYENVLAWVENTKNFKYCKSGVWTAVSIGGDAATSTLVKAVNEPAGGKCVAGGKAIQIGADTNGNQTLDASEVTDTQYVCNGTGSDAFAIKASYIASGDGTNLCTQFSETESCWMDFAQVDVFGNGNWQFRLMFNHSATWESAIDVADRDISFVIANGETGGAFTRVDNYVMRPDSEGANMFAVVLKTKTTLYLVTDTNANYQLDSDDEIIATYPLERLDP